MLVGPHKHTLLDKPQGWGVISMSRSAQTGSGWLVGCCCVATHRCVTYYLPLSTRYNTPCGAYLPLQ